jgi:lysophospholipase
VLLLNASQDRLVSVSAIDRAALRLPRGELLRFGAESRHEILRELDAVRDRALAGIDDFLGRVAPVRD